MLVGDAAVDSHRFPLLLKFLFPHEKLSVQVHPDDASAQAAGLPNGKTECWYVAHARPGAQIGLGLKSGITREEFEKAIYSNRAEELLNWIDVHAGTVPDPSAEDLMGAATHGVPSDVLQTLFGVTPPACDYSDTGC